MKTRYIVLYFLVPFLTFSQEPVSQTVGEFTELKVYDLINVQLVPSDENRVEISGENAKDVVVVNKNKTLKIRLKIDESFDGNNTNVRLFYTGVQILDANEGALISSDSEIEKYDLELRAQEGGMIKLKLNLKELESKAVTGGVLDLTGSVGHNTLKMNTGAIFKGKDLKTESTKISINAGGDARINASKKVDVNIKAGGDVYIYGDPEVVNESTIIGGRIKRMN